jgi:two-component system osmolarity sensor histidine kinase EnvZ
MNTSNSLALPMLEKDQTFNISELIENIVKKYKNSNISIQIAPRVYMNGRENLIQRSLNNLIDNAIKIWR